MKLLLVCAHQGSAFQWMREHQIYNRSKILIVTPRNATAVVRGLGGEVRHLWIATSREMRGYSEEVLDRLVDALISVGSQSVHDADEFVRLATSDGNAPRAKHA